MELKDIKVGKKVEVVTELCDDDHEGGIGEVISIDGLQPCPIRVDFGETTECYAPDELEEPGA